MIYLHNLKETFLDFPDDESLAVIAFFEGCLHNCPGCQNIDLQKRNDEHAKSWEEVFDIITERCKRSNTTKIVFSGGDPFDSSNKDNLVDMFKLISSLEDANFKICVYTGNTIDQVENLYNTYGIEKEEFPIDINHRTYINKKYYMPTYLKCGTYKEHLLNPESGKDNDTFILASSNQDFYKRTNLYKGEYNRVSCDGILRFR